jgi:hypothetical protein
LLGSQLVTAIPRAKPSPAARRIGSWVFLAVFWICLPLSWLWALLALFFFAAWPPPLRRLAAGLWIGATAAALALAPGFAAKAAFLLAGVLLVRLLWNLNRPRPFRNWADDQARLPDIRFSPDGNGIEIANVRDARPRPDGTLEVRWHPASLRLADVQTVDYVLVPFSSWRGIAHVFVTFGLADGRHFAVSIEARRERTESYSPLRGIFRNYEVCHIIGEERDLLGSRANLKKDPVYLFPLRATPEIARVLFTSILREAVRLADHPEFYNTLTNTCTRAIAIPANTLRATPINLLDPRIIFPGYSDVLLHRLSLLDSEFSLEETRRRALINERSAWHDDPREWSRQIRVQ